MAPVVLGIGLCVSALSGCVSLTTIGGSQEGVIGRVEVTLTGCGSKANTPGCELGSSNLVSNASGSGQVLVGLKVPADAAPPDALTTSSAQPFTVSRRTPRSSRAFRLPTTV